MSTELQFSAIKDELTTLCDGIIKKYLDGKNYDQKDAQSWCNQISDEIIKTLHSQQRGFKFICNGTIFQKGDASLHFSSTCLWNPNTDGSITVKYENDTMHCFICLFGIAP
jgi:dynein light chain Tctex-type 1